MEQNEKMDDIYQALPSLTKPYQALPSLTNPEPTIFSVDMATQRVLRNPVELLNHASYRARTALED